MIKTTPFEMVFIIREDMATSGNFNTNAYKHEGTNDERYLIFSWMVKSQNVQENKTVIEWTLEGGGGTYTSTYLTQNITVKIADVVVYDFPKSKGQIALRKGTVVASGTHTVTHTADGSKKFAVSVAAGIYEWDVNSTGTAEFVLPQIPRASKITAAEETVLGTACNIQWTPATAAYTYNLQFELGSWGYATALIAPGSTEPYTYTGYVLPLELAEEITAAKSAEVDVTLFTYDSNGEQIGEAQEAKLVVTVPEESTKPLIDITAITPIHANSQYTEDVFVQGKSKVRVSFDASGQYGASVDSTTVSIGGKAIEGDTSDYIGEYGEVEITVTAVDSRGISTSVTETIEVLPYSKPKVVPVDGQTEVICTRCDADGTGNDAGELLLVKAAASISALKVDDVAHNRGALWYRRKLASDPDSEYSDKIALVGEATGKNLFNKDANQYSGAYCTSAIVDDELVVTTTTSGQYISANFVIPNGELLVGKTITISGEWETSGSNGGCLRLSWTNKDNKHGIAGDVVRTSTSGTPVTKTIGAKPTNADQLALFIYGNWTGTGATGATVTYRNVQLEIGETATEYEPYNARTDAYDGVINSTFDKANRYTVQIGVTDDVGESAIMTFTIFSEDVYWHRGDGFLALGMHNEKGGFQTKWDAHFLGGVFINGVSLEGYIRNIIEGG